MLEASQRQGVVVPENTIDAKLGFIHEHPPVGGHVYVRHVVHQQAGEGCFVSVQGACIRRGVYGSGLAPRHIVEGEFCGQIVERCLFQLLEKPSAHGPCVGAGLFLVVNSVYMLPGHLVVDVIGVELDNDQVRGELGAFVVEIIELIDLDPKALETSRSVTRVLMETSV